MLTYVLITPARDEAEFIELTIKSVVAQTVRPTKWVIVSDGSTDGTDDIVLKYAAEHPWIDLVRMPPRQERHFAGKVHAFNAGYERVREIAFDAIVSLDADISFSQDYFSFLMGRLEMDPDLGLIGTPNAVPPGPMIHRCEQARLTLSASSRVFVRTATRRPTSLRPSGFAGTGAAGPCSALIPT